MCWNWLGEGEREKEQVSMINHVVNWLGLVMDRRFNY